MAAGVTACFGRPLWASMTLPPPASPEPLIDDKGTRRRAPVSDRSTVGSLVSAWRLPVVSNRKVTTLSLNDAPFFVGIDWAVAEHAVCVLDRSGRHRGGTLLVGRDARGEHGRPSQCARFGPLLSGSFPYTGPPAKPREASDMLPPVRSSAARD
ncbi:hypothetical protein GCM10017567_67530 [Amycolatopsis bullii]|uniref:Transposase n=1 Tax=Amycolatopsis bullii TaxID=941987 RepID=A0ABQ3KRJ7_9PSEU|nr:hypothetical protein GCM10017567_67530 [Amycolatopsis bullii]